MKVVYSRPGHADFKTVMEIQDGSWPVTFLIALILNQSCNELYLNRPFPSSPQPPFQIEAKC